MEFLSNFSPISNNLLNKLLHKTIGESCWKIPFSILQLTNKAEKAILWSKIHFFRNVARFARKLLSIRRLLLTHSKLIGTPCIRQITQFLGLGPWPMMNWVDQPPPTDYLSVPRCKIYDTITIAKDNATRKTLCKQLP